MIIRRSTTGFNTHTLPTYFKSFSVVICKPSASGPLIYFLNINLLIYAAFLRLVTADFGREKLTLDNSFKDYFRYMYYVISVSPFS